MTEHAVRVTRLPGDSEPPEPEPSAGRLGRRRALPNGRAVAGGFSVAAAAVLVFAAYLGSRPDPGRPWVVARAALAAGTRLQAGDLHSVTLRLGSGGAAAAAFSSPSGLVGRTLAVGLLGGELVTSAELTPQGAQPALRPVALSVPATDLVTLASGDLADVLVTEGNAPQTRTLVVVRGAEVVATSGSSSGLSATGSSGVVTLGVRNLAEVQALVGASHAGTVDLVVGEPSDGVGLGPAGSSGG